TQARSLLVKRGTAPTTVAVPRRPPTTQVLRKGHDGSVQQRRPHIHAGGILLGANGRYTANRDRGEEPVANGRLAGNGTYVRGRDQGPTWSMGCCCREVARGRREMAEAVSSGGMQ